MIKKFILDFLTLIGVTPISVHVTSASLVSEESFAKKYIHMLEKELPGAKISKGEKTSLHFHVNYDETNFEVFLDNTYKLYVQEPELLEELLIKNINAAKDFSIRQKQRTIDINNIIPIIKNSAYIEHVKKTGVTPCYEYLNHFLVLVYGENREHATSYFSKELLKKSNIDEKNLRTEAIKNIKSYFSSNVEISDSKDNVYCVTGDGNYDSSLILIDNVMDKNNFDLKGHLVFAIPARDSLFVTGSDEKEGITYLQEITDSIYSEHPYSISNQLFTFNEGQIIPFHIEIMQ